MARTHSSYTASPTRTRSPHRSPASRSSSEDGSQYEMDLDALGLDSTFESAALEGSFEPRVDRVATSDVEGPDDFTMNMTYWMTADLPPPAAVSRNKRRRGSPPARATDTSASERSMPNEEKVRSFLSALPDAAPASAPPTPRAPAPASSPLRAPRPSTLQVPRPSPPKARSLQATVEDCDAPRKPIQRPVVRPSPAARDDTRVTELETILAYTRNELEAARSENYTHKDAVARLERASEEHRASQDASAATANSRLRAVEDAHAVSLQQLEEKLRGDHARALQAQQEHLTQTSGVERTELQNKLALLQIRADTLQADLARATAEAVAARADSHRIASLETQLRDAQAARADDHHSRIATLEAQLQDAQFSLECSQADVAAKAQLFQTNIDLNASLRTLRGELETQRIALTDRGSKVDSTSAVDEQLQAELTAKNQIIAQHAAERDDLERQLSTAQGRTISLETSLTTLRTQLADAHRESGSARTDAERLSQDVRDANERLIDAHAETERRVAEIEKKLTRTKDLKAEAETKFRELKSQHDDLIECHAAMLEDVRDKAEDAVRKTGALLAQERKEKSRLRKDVARLHSELDALRAEPTRTPPADADPTPPADPNDAALRALAESHAAALKALKASHASDTAALVRSHDAALHALQSRLDAQAADHAAVNAALDEQLSHLLSKLMKERARHVVGRRDGQWEEVQRGAAGEKELLGKVLMRQWGREECGVGGKEGGKQVFEYQYVKRER
ncbi:hypothetical protein C7974DRAFT_448827 [Boeremia exigua]|uniref:uncharacterized protein n=1 Tax=Boeremia exigua TaxID=749465 RepID=UPI001E8DCCDE|nr:uncharacterized protein C7974DRAFT_448827 [Boeremia exigua]KAH6638998.1 hypothetical protein C7974DRAFT_448827 [Boeremia exigua]